jgi:UDP-glucose 6-dehydrogenase
MKTVIFAKGRVGEATEMTLRTHCDWHDPPKGLVVTDFSGYDLAITCAPSLVDGPSDYAALFDNLELLHRSNFKGLFVVRSTVSPAFFRTARSMYPSIRMIHFPEFMRQQEDHKMDSPWILVLGGEREETEPFGKWLIDRGYGNRGMLHYCNTDESCLIKLHQNAGLAIKVIFSNLMYEACKEYGADYETVRQGVVADVRVGPGHTQVPGEHGFGFAGHCLPKDVKCLNTSFDSRGFWSTVLQINEQLRTKAL